MPRLACLAACLLLLASSLPLAAATQWGRPMMVGPGETYVSLADAARAARPGTTVRLTPGIYRECAVWTAHHLTIQAEPNTARVEGPLCEGRAQFILRGNDITIDGVDFAGARGTDATAAAVRIEGRSATVRRATFRANSRGVLAVPRAGSIVRIENTSFEGGAPGPAPVQVEALGIARLSIDAAHFLAPQGGVAVRSAARTTEITSSTIEDGSAASRLLVEIAGANAVVRGNRFRKTMARPGAATTAIILTTPRDAQPGQQVFIVNNSIRNDTAASLTFVRNLGPAPAQVMGNVFSGAPVTEVEGAAAPFVIPPPERKMPP
ncbi:hypothetical protein [Pedomonas sp. V897]|uniref:hypothetical protein n=1 Tax=Pedomonas sp. V897 TaxID=3446482 RepID=UPI003EE40126